MPTILRNFTPSTARPFLGREKLLDELGKMLSSAGSSSPIVAVTGIMGVGKTRLVAEYAQQNSVPLRYRMESPCE